MDGHRFISSVEIRKDMMAASSGQIATELDVSVGHETYTVFLNRYQQPSLSVIAGATIKITGNIVGNAIYASEIDTIQKPKETKYVLLRSIASPE